MSGSRLPEQAPPQAERRPVTTTIHGHSRVDDYAWLRDPAYPEVQSVEIRDYLETENAYLEAALRPVKDLQDRVFEELRGRVQPNDDSVPSRKGAFWYQERYLAEHEHPQVLRWREGEGREQALCLLDLDAMAKDHEYFDLGDFSPSPDQSVFAYSVDLDGSERHEARFRRDDLQDLPDRIPEVQGEVVWSADGRHVFYAKLDEHHRPSRIFRHALGAPIASDVLVYEETDPAFWLSVEETSDEAFIVISSNDKETAEVRLLDKRTPEAEPWLVLARRSGHEYDVDHHRGQLYVRTNDRHKNFRIVVTAITDVAETSWQEVIPPSDDCYLRGFALFAEHMVVLEREAGLPHVRVRTLASGGEHRIDFPDPVYMVSIGDNPEFTTRILRLSYQSLVSPPSVLDYDMDARTTELKKQQEIPSGYDKAEYTSRRLFATAPDGARVPISLVHRVDSPPHPQTPLYLYVYGSYGATIDPYFSPNRLSLLNRGFAFAIAHVRGSSVMGRHWYEDGKGLKKQNTFSDIRLAVEELERQGVSSRGRVTISGGSAGGMAVGAVINQAPSYFHAAVASVPFVDCLNTMLDGSLPLTPPEYSEWGNPEKDPEVYRYMLGYSPYDNVVAQDYPHLLVTAGIADPRVTYWEPAKWVAKLRALKRDQNLLVMHTNMTAGHGGASGRFEALKELAREYAFLLWVYDHPDTHG
ncbi:MAG: S9 family peptidase [Polyangiaceae bacterium]|nr:S9 family peptidase [Polyangiaceae bacterium]MCB9605739.1 S9 family peptidase [Polyangiaceae bacterium]